MKKKRKGCHVSAYLDDALKAKAEKAADAQLLTLSAWFRRLISTAVGEVRP
jgi:hypothetical protein